LNLAGKMFDENQTVSFFNSKNFRESGVHLAAGHRGEGGIRIPGQALNEPLLMATTHAAVTTNTKYKIQMRPTPSTTYGLPG